jgi:hypothetical protein
MIVAGVRQGAAARSHGKRQGWSRRAVLFILVIKFILINLDNQVKRKAAATTRPAAR